MPENIFKRMYDMLDEVAVCGHKNIKRMDAVMDTLHQFSGISENEKEGNANENRDQQRENA